MMGVFSFAEKLNLQWKGKILKHFFGKIVIKIERLTEPFKTERSITWNKQH